MNTLSFNFSYLLPAYLIFVNLLAVMITVIDKRRAIRHKYRISENMLLLIALFGGSTAMYITMRTIHHKTKHPKFMIGIPIIWGLQVAALIYFLVQ